jgi:hypothetical protein
MISVFFGFLTSLFIYNYFAQDMAKYLYNRLTGKFNLKHDNT